MSAHPPFCFFDAATAQDSPLFLIGGTYLCQVHARCAGCQVPLLEVIGPVVSCPCEDYNYGQHEENLYCSMECMENSHPEPPDREPKEEEG